MEASCLFTVASAVGVAAAAAFAVSDVLHGEQWAPHFGAADILHGSVDAVRGGRGMPVRVTDAAIGFPS